MYDKKIRKNVFLNLQGGEYLVNLLNIYGPGISILFVVFVYAVGVCWFYGVDRFSSDIQLMIGIRPGLFWRLCWNWISPLFILVIFLIYVINAHSNNHLLLGHFHFLSGELRGPEDR
jgi:SNF family Na+-dependent transporter